LPYSRNEVNFEFGYSAKSFQQSAVEFAYKLEGYDADWKISTSKIEQAFNGLPAGSYKFLLKAKASNQIWSTPISFSFNISSPWWEKWWFRLLELLAVFAGIYGLIQLRTRTLVQQKMKLEAVVEERTAEIVSQKEIIEKEKDKSEELLLNILPVDIADELKNTGRSEARRFENVTILFTDFKDFTKISEGLSPEELVKEIDFCFRAFDEITAKFGVEKIKTIGDAYMAAGGLPKTNLSHPIDVVNAGLEIVAFMAAYKEKRQAIGLESFEIRIGIHTGPVVAGIVGTRKFAYDIWGDTVNLASRMESSGEPGKINISSVTYDLVKNQFECSYRGKIKAKNKGEVDMYFVEKRI
jgi:class 3 adenylate cyclase